MAELTQSAQDATRACFGKKWDESPCGKPAVKWLPYVTDEFDQYEGEWFCEGCARFQLRRSMEHGKL